MIPFLTAPRDRDKSPLVDHYNYEYVHVLSVGSVSAGPFGTGTHHDCQMIIRYHGDAVSNGPCDRDFFFTTTDRPPTCACLRMVTASDGPLISGTHRECQTTILCATIPFLTGRTTRENNSYVVDHCVLFPSVCSSAVEN